MTLDLGVALPGSGCLVPRFEGKLMIGTVSFVVVSLLFVVAWAIANGMGHDNVHNYLRRFVEVRMR